MALERIVDLHLRNVSVAAERALQALAVGEDHDEVVDADEPALDGRTARRRDGDGDFTPVRRAGRGATTATTTTARHPGILKRHRIADARRDSCEVARDRVTRGAFRLEIGLPGSRVADQNVQ